MDKLQSLKNFILQDLLLAVVPEEVLEYKDNVFYIHGTPLSYEQSEELVNEAKALKKLQLWQWLFQDMKRISNKRIFEHSQSFQDMEFGKAVLYVVDVIEKKITNIANMKLNKVEKQK